MRVIGGEFRSRRLQSLPGMETRPTSDKMRETLFNILGPAIAGCVFVDGYAGTGAVGIEALSRGARHAVFIEKDRKAADLIKSNLAALGVEARARVIRGSAPLYLASSMRTSSLSIRRIRRSGSIRLRSMRWRHRRRSWRSRSIRCVLLWPTNMGRCAEHGSFVQGENSLSFFRPSTFPLAD